MVVGHSAKAGRLRISIGSSPHGIRRKRGGFMIEARHILLPVILLCSLSRPLSADSFTITFTPQPGSTGGAIGTATTSFTSGPVSIDWGPDVFTVSATDLSEMLTDCAPLSTASKACASYTASDAGLSDPTLNVGPLLGIDDDGRSKASFTLLASSANPTCLLLECSSFGTVSLADLSPAAPIAAPEPAALGMLLLGILGFSLLFAAKRLGS